MSLWCGTSRRVRLPVDDGLTVVRMLANIDLHCSDFMVFRIIFALRADSAFVSGLESFVYVARRSE